MVVNRKPTGMASSMAGGLAWGAAVSMGATVLITAVMAWMLSKEYLPQERIGYGIMVLLTVSSFLGAYTAAARIKRRRLLVCCCASGVYFGILMCLTALFFGGQYYGVWAGLMMIACGGVLAFLPGLSAGRGGKHRKFR